MKEIIDVLKIFQKGYEEKKIENAFLIMEEIFSHRQDLLVLGTGSSEVCIGRDEVKKLIHDDWNGGWGDFTIDIEGAKIDVAGNTAWFYADCTVKYSFEDSDDENKSDVDFVKEIVENQDITPKQGFAFLNWALGIHHHKRKPNKRDYLWPNELSGMLIKENGAWKIATLHFATAKSNYPDERYEESVEDYQALHNSMRDKIVEHNGNKADGVLVSLLKQLENEMADDAELGRICFDSEQVLVFDFGQFLWIMTFGTSKKSISEGEIFDKSLREIHGLLNSDLLPEDKLFQVKRSIASALKETASGEEFTWPIRLTAVVEKAENGYKFRHKHFSYPFYWIFEGKL